MILRSPLTRIHYYQNKWLQVKESQYLIPTYSWTLIPIPNWTCSVVKISHFQCTVPSTWLTNRCMDPSTRLNHQLEKDVGRKILQFITRWRSWICLVTKPYGIQTQQLLQKKDESWSLTSLQSSPIWKARGQKSILSGISIRTNCPTGRLAEQV